MPIISYLLKRLLQAVFVIVAVSLLVALAIRMTGDPAVMMMGASSHITEADLDNIRMQMGLNRPFLFQYSDFMMGLINGNLGNSFFRGAISPLLWQAMKSTMLLASVSLLVSLCLSLPLGIYAARHKNTWVDQLIRILSLTGLSFPNFWLGIMLMLLFSVTLQWLPVSGFSGIESLVLPATTIGIILTASNLRIIRTAMLEVLSAQYIMVARAKGLSENRVIYYHALRNASITIVTYLGLQFGGLMGGLVVVELVFNWPGLGTLAMEAISQRDYPILQTVVTVLAVMIVFVNLVVDIMYALLDPRIRLE